MADTASDGLTTAQRAARAQAEADLASPHTRAFLDMISPTCNRSTRIPFRRTKVMASKAVFAFAASLLVVFAFGAPRPSAADISAFQKPPSAVKSAISGNFRCSWRHHRDAAEECGDDLIVLNRGADGRVESVELTCPISPAGKASATCRRQALWIVSAFLPSWSKRDYWVTKLFLAPPRKGRWIKTSVGGAIVLAQIDGPADLDIKTVVLGVTRGDPAQWDLPR